MIQRIVKMTFLPEQVENFLALFEEVKHKIRGREGCLGLNLLRDIKHSNILFTYSYWRSEADLNAYRDSELFAVTWRDTKSKFSAKAEAWSVQIQSETL